MEFEKFNNHFHLKKKEEKDPDPPKAIQNDFCSQFSIFDNCDTEIMTMYDMQIF